MDIEWVKIRSKCGKYTVEWADLSTPAVQSPGTCLLSSQNHWCSCSRRHIPRKTIPYHSFVARSKEDTWRLQEWTLALLATADEVAWLYCSYSSSIVLRDRNCKVDRWTALAEGHNRRFESTIQGRIKGSSKVGWGCRHLGDGWGVKRRLQRLAASASQAGFRTAGAVGNAPEAILMTFFSWLSGSSLEISWEEEISMTSVYEET